MDYSVLIKSSNGKKSRVGIVGATSGYGYTLLAQISQVSLMELRMICALDAGDCQRVLLELGYDKENMVICENARQLYAAPDQAILILTDYRLVPETDITALVECTGNTVVGSWLSEEALKKGIHVYMVSKETDSVCGVAMNQIAEKYHSIYTLVNGDQPRNLLDLISWGRVLGLDIVCAGKSSEYDFVWDPDTGEFTYLNDTDQPREPMPGMKALWHYEGTETLKKRECLLEKYRAVISADLCEMNLVSNATGMPPACKSMHYPVAKISELADIFIPGRMEASWKKPVLWMYSAISAARMRQALPEVSFSSSAVKMKKCGKYSPEKAMWSAGTKNMPVYICPITIWGWNLPSPFSWATLWESAPMKTAGRLPSWPPWLRRISRREPSCRYTATTILSTTSPRSFGRKRRQQISPPSIC